MKWEMLDADSGHSDNLYRAKVPFGWLVKCVSYFETDKVQGIGYLTNLISSVTYVFDPFKLWKP